MNNFTGKTEDFRRLEENKGPEKQRLEEKKRRNITTRRKILQTKISEVKKRRLEDSGRIKKIVLEEKRLEEKEQEK